VLDKGRPGSADIVLSIVMTAPVSASGCRRRSLVARSITVLVVLLCMLAGAHVASATTSVDVTSLDESALSVGAVSMVSAISVARRRTATAQTPPAERGLPTHRTLSQYSAPRVLSWWTPALWRGPPLRAS
jgi:hypothetical protein